MMDPAPLSHLEKLCQDETWPILICKTVFNPQSVQAGDYLISTSPAHCEFMHFDEPTPLTGVYMAVSVTKPRQKSKWRRGKRRGHHGRLQPGATHIYIYIYIYGYGPQPRPSVLANYKEIRRQLS